MFTHCWDGMSNGSTFVSTHCLASNVCQFDLSLSKKRPSKRSSGEQENFHSSGIEAGLISIVWPPLLLDRDVLLKVPNKGIKTGKC